MANPGKQARAFATAPSKRPGYASLRQGSGWICPRPVPCSQGADTPMPSAAPDRLPRNSEPDAAALRSPLKRYLLATRPAFLTITLVGGLLGIASAVADGVPLDGIGAAATLLLALCAHAAVNVHNDYCDHLNGTDAGNTGRIFPFTGGSRFIQNGVLTPAQTRGYAMALFAVTIIGGSLLVLRAGGGLLGIGLVGVLVGWAYSSPPLRLNSRGVGEACVALTFWLVVVGADFVQRSQFSSTPALAGIHYALLTTDILYIKQFQAREADIAAGKLHWVARLSPLQAAWGYVLILAAATIAILAPVLLGLLPRGVALGVMALVPAAGAARSLLRDANRPQLLAGAIRQTIAAAHLAALTMAVGMFEG